MRNNQHLKQVGDIIINTKTVITNGHNYTSYLGTLKDNPKNLLEVMIFNLDNITKNDSGMNLIRRHLQFIKNFNHRNILQFHSANQTQNHLYLSFEYCENRLSNKISNSVHCPMSEIEIIKIFKQLCFAYKDVCLANNIVHRNLKPKNIQFDKEGNVKISNFQVAESSLENDLSKEKVLNSIAGSKGYMAPEILNDKGYSNSCDLYSLGVILYEMIYQQLPFNSETNRTPQDQISFPSNRTISGELKSLITKMLNADPQQRISWESLFSDPLIKTSEITPQSQCEQ